MGVDRRSIVDDGQRLATEGRRQLVLGRLHAGGERVLNHREEGAARRRWAVRCVMDSVNARLDGESGETRDESEYLHIPGPAEDDEDGDRGQGYRPGAIRHAREVLRLGRPSRRRASVGRGRSRQRDRDWSRLLVGEGGSTRIQEEEGAYEAGDQETHPPHGRDAIPERGRGQAQAGHYCVLP